MKPFILLILDGWGWSKKKLGNAILAAKTSFLDYLKKNYPFFLLQASGYAVGLPPLEEGNSEAGHLTLGSGRVVPQHLTIINNAIKDGSFFENKNLLKLLNHLKENNSRLHLITLLTSGTVHASLDHLLAIINFLKTKNLPQIFLHLFTDGKDSGKKESLILLKKIEDEISNFPQFKIATIIGREFAMNRKENWEMTKRAYNLLVFGEGNKVNDLINTIKNYHNQEITDEIIPPIILTEDLSGTIKDNDGVLFLNFREDNAKQLTRAFTEKGFNFFETKKFKNLFFATMTNYQEGLNIFPLFEREKIINTLGEVLQNSNKSQLHIAESIKHDHLTYFFNGLREKPFRGETDIIIDSLDNPEKNPQMHAKEIAEEIIKEIEKENFDFIVANFANADILAHSGNFEAAIRGVEAIDQAIGKIYEILKNKNLKMIITADHGNAEAMTYPGSGEKETKHELNPVPFYLVAEEFKKEKNDKEIEREEKEIKGMLSDIAPTILDLMKIKKPKEMTGISLINFIKNI